MALLQDIRALEERLAETPEDLVGWITLGSLRGEMQDHENAAEAYGRALELSDGDPRVASLQAEAIVNADSGVVTQDARRRFEGVLDAVPDDPRARYYLALAREQAGDLEGALERWIDLAAESPADAPWLPMVRGQISQTAIRVGMDVGRATPEPRPPAGQSPDLLASDPATAARVITAIEEALAEEPGRVDLWIRTADLRARLGDHAGAAEAFGAAVANAPAEMPDEDRARLLEARAGAIMADRDGDIESLLTPDFIGLMDRLLALDPDSDRALWFLGIHAEEQGDTATARRHWSALLDGLPPDSETAALLRDRLDNLSATP